MGYREITIQIPPGYGEEALKHRIQQCTGLEEFTYEIRHKSLDARKKKAIVWQMKIGVFSSYLDGDPPSPLPGLHIPYEKRNRKAVVVGSGPAGFFAGYVLGLAGYDVTIVERGSDVETRKKGIRLFETTGVFNEHTNYAFGEGGAGTFSDGKLTSRSKHISREKQFILDKYIEAGAPEEIAYLAKPHLGSDHLKLIVRNLRHMFQEQGGTIRFDTRLLDLVVQKGRVSAVTTTKGDLEADIVMIAPGHSAYDTYRMLMKRGVGFRTKNFAIGCRVEHPQHLINMAQWGRPSLPGTGPAEYFLSDKKKAGLPVYTFCMCPGGTIVPATPFGHTNIVNGMSLYKRSGPFANAACVAGVNIDRLLSRPASPEEALDYMEKLEAAFFDVTKSFKAPFCTIDDFIHRSLRADQVETSYPLGVSPAPLWDMLPGMVADALQEGLTNFCRKIKGFETGTIMGLESKTSAPIQVIRDERLRVEGFHNLYLIGEGSGFAGGIISSGADGIRAAMTLVSP